MTARIFKFLFIAICCPFVPLFSYFLSGNIDYIKRYFTTTIDSMSYLDGLIESKCFIRFAKRRFQKEEKTYQIAGYCNNCGNCCINKKCIFLRSDDSLKFYCSIYHSKLRKLFNCAEYPINEEELVFYNCPTYYVVSNPHIDAFRKRFLKETAVSIGDSTDERN